MNIIKLLRISHWVKNGFILLPVFFAGELFHLHDFTDLLLSVLAFSFTGSSVYVINDIFDKERDALHPVKCERPIAAGRIKVGIGWGIAILFCLGGLTLMYFISTNSFVLLFGYFVMNLAYSIKLKHFAIVDVIVIALGFVIRVYIGGEIGAVYISKWIIMMTFLLAVSLAVGKRRDDLISVKSKSEIRPVLSAYNIDFVNMVLVVTFTITLVCYIMYSVSADVQQRLGSEFVFITSLPVFIGILRYLQLIFVYKKSGSPTKILLKDRFIQLAIGFWMTLFATIIYY